MGGKGKRIARGSLCSKNPPPWLIVKGGERYKRGKEKVKKSKNK